MRRAVRRHGIGDGRLLVAASGGPDSTTLVLALAAIAPELNLSLTLAHFDHELRERSDEDAAFVRTLGDRLGLRCVSGSGDVRAHARREGRSLEDAARRMRYGFLAGAARQAGAAAVAVGHTLDDQAESVLLHLLRGSGLRGLGAMAPLDAWPVEGGAGLAVFRPLLELRRGDTEAYCRDAGVEPRVDESNVDRRFLRNRVRADLMPVLEGYNPRIAAALARLAEAARTDTDHLDRQAATAAEALLTTDGDALALPRDLAARLPRALLLRVLTAAVEGARPGRVDSAALLALERMVREPRSGQRVDLGGGWRATAEGRWLRLRGPEARHAVPREARLQVPGSVVFGRWRIRGEPSPASESEDPWRHVAYLGAGELVVRARKPGDRVAPVGMSGTKKLQDVFVDARVPRAEREVWPIVCAPDGHIVWVPGLVRGRDVNPTAGYVQPVLLTAGPAE